MRDLSLFVRWHEEIVSLARIGMPGEIDNYLLDPEKARTNPANMIARLSSQERLVAASGCLANRGYLEVASVMADIEGVTPESAEDWFSRAANYAAESPNPDDSVADAVSEYAVEDYLENPNCWQSSVHNKIARSTTYRAATQLLRVQADDNEFVETVERLKQLAGMDLHEEELLDTHISARNSIKQAEKNADEINLGDQVREVRSILTQDAT